MLGCFFFLITFDIVYNRIWNLDKIINEISYEVSESAAPGLKNTVIVCFIAV